MSETSEKDFNFVSGVVTLALLAVLGVVVLVMALVSKAPEPGPMFVAYFDESAGLKKGDQVRLLGRRAGTVHDVRLAQVDGRTRVRVEFELLPGEGLPWLNRLATDTSAEIEPGGMRSGPRLVLRAGEHSESISPGGEIKDTKSGAKDDQLQTYRNNLLRADQVIDDAVKIVDSPAFAQALRAVKEMGDRLTELGPGIDSAARSAPDVVAALDKLRANFDSARGSVDDAGKATESALAAANRNTEGMAGELEALHDKVKRVQDSVANLATAVESVARGFDGAGTANLGRDLRVLAARLRASQDMSARDPSLIGDLPPRRFWRPYFHGDGFKPGTNVADEE